MTFFSGIIADSLGAPFAMPFSFAKKWWSGLTHGKTTTPITLGSLTGNATKVEQEMYFSKELQKLNGFIGPKIMKIKNVTIAGN